MAAIARSMLGVVGDVERDARDPAAGSGDLALQRGELVQLARGEADRGAVLRQYPGEALAEALRGAGDQRDAAGEVEQIVHRGLLRQMQAAVFGQNTDALITTDTSRR